MEKQTISFPLTANGNSVLYSGLLSSDATKVPEETGIHPGAE